MLNSVHNQILRFQVIVSYAIIFIFCGIPLSSVIIHSFTTNALSSDIAFVGFRNYLSIMQDGVFWQSILNSFILLLYIPVLMFVGLWVAIYLREGFALSGLYKGIIVFPEIIASLTVAGIFSCLFGYRGPVNALLELFNIPPLYWLGNKSSAFVVIILCIIYTSFGWHTMIFSGALTTVPQEISSLIKVDGVRGLNKIKIYTYEIRKTIYHSFLLNLIYGFSSFFSIIYTLTKGGPGYNTTTIDYLIYLRAFKYGSDLSSAYTIAAILFFVVMTLVTILYNILFGKRADL